MSFNPQKDLGRDIALTLSRRYDSADMLGLPVFKDGRPLPLEKIYVPLSFRWDVGPNERRFYLPEALEANRHLVALGDPGCGKSTLVKVIVYSFGRSAPTPLRQRFGDLIPIPIILRDHNIRQWKSKEDLLRAFVRTIDKDVTVENEEKLAEWLLEELRQGRGFLLLDGLDEVGSPSDRKHLRDRVVRPLLKEAFRSYAILTSRIVGYEEVPFGGVDPEKYAQDDPDRWIPPPAPLRRCYVAPFNDEDIEQFVVRWYTAREPDPERRREGIESLKLALDQNDRVKRLASNPSLLTLMALIHRVTAHLPSGRVRLYDKIVEAYLETIDRYRKLGVSFPASLEEMKRWLARVGWEMQSRRDTGQETELLAGRADVMRWLKAAIEAEGREDAEAEAHDFLDYVARRSGLLIPRGPDQFSFAHLTLQEYFAAFYLRGRAMRFDWLAAECSKLALNHHWHETLCVLFEMLTEFPGMGDELLDVLKEAGGKNEGAMGSVAVFFSALLLDEQNGLSPEKRRQVADYALDAACRSYNHTIAENLKQLPPERFETLVVQWFDRRLKDRRSDQFGENFFFIGDELIADWPKRLGDWIERRGAEKLDEIQTTFITIVGAGDLRVCDWSVSRLPISTWLRPLIGYLWAGNLNLADIYR
ncbi:MAG: NACHT domain-containing protein, partial [Blastocatellia bacterium]